MYDWMRFVVERNLPLAEVESQLTRKLVNMQPTTSEVLKAAMRRVTHRVGVVVSEEMSDDFGLMFDGRSAGTLHFIAVVAVNDVSGESRERVIGLSPLIEHLSAIIEVYGKSMVMVKFLVGDSRATNQSIATKLGIPLIGCAGHSFNLAVVRLLADSEDLISQIQKAEESAKPPQQ